MKQGRTLEQLGEELQRQREARQDFLSDTTLMDFKAEDNGRSFISLNMKGKTQKFAVNELAHQQIAQRLQIPYRYYQKMMVEQPDLLSENVNTWFHYAPERRMLRTLDGEVRAFLSDRYRRLDNLELCEAVLPIIRDMPGASINSCEVTPTHMYLKVVNKKLKAEVAVGDAVQAGFVISNSEVGLGSVKIEPLIYRLVCKNGLVLKDYTQKKYHVGRQVEGDGAYELYSDETLKADDKAFFMKVQDTVKVAADEAKFIMAVDKLKESMDIPLGKDPVKEVELLADKYQLNPNERGDVLRQLFMGKDNSRYGLINAVTAASKMASSYERATDLERIGGEILAEPLPKVREVINITPVRSLDAITA